MIYSNRIFVWCLCGLSTQGILVGVAKALVVQVQSEDEGTPPEIVYANGSAPSLEVVLELANETGVDTLPIFLWQLDLQLQGETGSTGIVEFESIGVPDGSLFGEPGPRTSSELPTIEIVAYDDDLDEFAGVVIPAQSEIPIVKFGLLPSVDAGGVFVLTMATFDTGDLDHTSYWTTDDFEPTTFDNPLGESPRIELAFIRVIGTGSPTGDYNHDLVVDAADYTVWRNGLGSTYSPDDYDVWKQHFGESVMGAGGESLPEPSSLWLVIPGGLIGLNACVRGARKL